MIQVENSLSKPGEWTHLCVSKLVDSYTWGVALKIINKYVLIPAMEMAVIP